MAPDEHTFEPIHLAGDGQAPLQPQRRRLAQAEHAVDRDRVADAGAGHQPVRVVVGHLVGRDVRPHVQCAHRHVPGDRASRRDAERGRGDSGGSEDRGWGQGHPSPERRRSHACGYQGPGGCSDSPRQPQRALSIRLGTGA